jgi:hypothetical protein
MLPDGWIVWPENKVDPFRETNDVASVEGVTGFGGVIQAREAVRTESWEYNILKQDGGDRIFDIGIVKGGDPFIGCFCAHREDYDYTKTSGYRVWSIRMQDMVRTRKVASKHYRLDIHCRYGAQDSNLLDHVIDSAWPAR